MNDCHMDAVRLSNQRRSALAVLLAELKDTSLEKARYQT